MRFSVNKILLFPTKHAFLVYVLWPVITSFMQLYMTLVICRSVSRNFLQLAHAVDELTTRTEVRI